MQVSGARVSVASTPVALEVRMAYQGTKGGTLIRVI